MPMSASGTTSRISPRKRTRRPPIGHRDCVGRPSLEPRNGRHWQFVPHALSSYTIDRGSPGTARREGARALITRKTPPGR